MKDCFTPPPTTVSERGAYRRSLQSANHEKTVLMVDDHPVRPQSGQCMYYMVGYSAGANIRRVEH